MLFCLNMKLELLVKKDKRTAENCKNLDMNKNIQTIWIRQNSI